MFLHPAFNSIFQVGLSSHDDESLSELDEDEDGEDELEEANHCPFITFQIWLSSTKDAAWLSWLLQAQHASAAEIPFVFVRLQILPLKRVKLSFVIFCSFLKSLVAIQPHVLL